MARRSCRRCVRRAILAGVHPYPLLPRPDRALLAHEPWEYGRSANGLPLVGYGPDPGEGLVGDAQPVLLIAGIHGNEPDTTVALSSALRCVRVGAVRVRVVLAANPDGLLAGTRGNAHGVDLNRNFPASDFSTEPAMLRWASGLPYDTPMPAGSHPASEPEVEALRSLVVAIDPAVVIAFHSPLAWVDDPDAGATSRWLAERTGLPLVEDAGYPTSGAMGTWCQEAGRAGVTFEFEGASNTELRLRYTQVLADLLTGRAPIG